MKKFGTLTASMLVLIMIGFIGLPACHAQIGKPATLVSGSVTNDSIASTNQVDVGDCSTLSVQATLTDQSGSATATNTCTLASEVSIDGVNWLTGPTLSITAIGSNTTSTCISNYAVLPYRKWRTITINNGASPTNAILSLVVSKKPGL